MIKTLLILIIILFSANCFALQIGTMQYWFVNKDLGSDTTYYGYTVEQPLATLQFTADILVAGTTVHYKEVILPYTVIVSTGIYAIATQIDLDTNSGTDNAHRITFEADRFGIWNGVAGEVTITRSGASTPIRLLSINNESYITIRGFEFVPERRVMFIGSTSKTDRYIIIEECFMHNNITSNTVLLGIQVQYCDNTVVRNCIFSDFNAGNSHTNGMYILYSEDVLVYNNVFYNMKGADGATYDITFIHSDTGAAFYAGGEIKNNIFSTGDDWIIYFDMDDIVHWSMDCNYNCLYRNGATETGRYDGTDYTTLQNWIDNTPYGDNSQEGDPLLENVGGLNREDYKIRNLSPYIDAGTVLAEVTVDGWQLPRLSNDIGVDGSKSQAGIQ